MSVDRVTAWLDHLRAHKADCPTGPLSEEGRDLILGHALDVLTPRALRQIATTPAPDCTAIVVARTSMTAPLEWAAMQLARGGRVLLKHPSGAPGLTTWFASTAAAHGLPLTATDDRQALAAADLLIALSSDDTIDTLRRQWPDTPLLGFGHKFSVAWLTDAREADALAADLAAHDSRGCMSPSVVLTPRSREEILPVLTAALDAAQARWPRGSLQPAEAAALRSRTAMVRVVGEVVEGRDWQLHRVPAARALPATWPRVLQLVTGATEADLQRFIGPRLSVLGIADGALPGLELRPTARRCPLGEMQRPPFPRRHDGVDMVEATAVR